MNAVRSADACQFAAGRAGFKLVRSTERAGGGTVRHFFSAARTGAFHQPFLDHLFPAKHFFLDEENEEQSESDRSEDDQIVPDGNEVQ